MLLLVSSTETDAYLVLYKTTVIWSFAKDKATLGFGLLVAVEIWVTFIFLVSILTRKVANVK